jgi:hypothetical protein
MRKLFLLLISCGIISLSDLVAQPVDYTNDNNITYRNSNIFGGGLSLGYYNYGYIGSRSIGFPPLYAYVETGLHDKITGGPFIAFGKWNYRYTGFAQPYNYTWSFTDVGARGSLHLSGFINDTFGADINENKTDWYVTLLLGLEYRRYTTETIVLDDNYSNSIHLLFGPLAGVRLYFTDYFAVFFEAGRGSLGILSVGLSLKL